MTRWAAPFIPCTADGGSSSCRVRARKGYPCEATGEAESGRMAAACVAWGLCCGGRRCKQPLQYSWPCKRTDMLMAGTVLSGCSVGTHTTTGGEANLQHTSPALWPYSLAH